jgi:hypothetical protein
MDDGSTEVEWNVLITSLYCNDMEGVIRIESYSVYVTDMQGCLGCMVLSSHLYMQLGTTQFYQAASRVDWNSLQHTQSYLVHGEPLRPRNVIVMMSERSAVTISIKMPRVETVLEDMNSVQ